MMHESYGSGINTVTVHTFMHPYIHTSIHHLLVCTRLDHACTASVRACVCGCVLCANAVQLLLCGVVWIVRVLVATASFR